MSRVCVLLANGFEEIEAVTIIDVLRRAEMDVAIVGVTDREVVGSHRISVTADVMLAQAKSQIWDAIVLPGGMPGARNLQEHPGVQEMLREQHHAERHIGAICAAPIALASAGVLQGRRATSYPAFAAQLGDVQYCEDTVVVDGHVTTSRGPSTALPFALSLVAQLAGEAKARQLAEQMLVRA
ncbi:MAG: DJ-1 family glyoxalase III [Candidatus Xenobia bacterium]